jgi:hypothetical protein
MATTKHMIIARAAGSAAGRAFVAGFAQQVPARVPAHNRRAAALRRAQIRRLQRDLADHASRFG